MTNMQQKIRDLFDKGRDQGTYKGAVHEGNVTYLFEGVKHLKSVPLREFIEVHGNEYACTPLREDSTEQEDPDSSDPPIALSGNQLQVYKVGDIVMTNNYISQQTGENFNDPHMVLITTVDVSNIPENEIRYEGFIMSSKYRAKSNKYNSRYPNNLYYDDFKSLLYRGYGDKGPGFIRLDDKITFTNKDMSVTGSWKGSVLHSFIRFIENGVSNMERGSNANATKYWISIKPQQSTVGGE